MKYGSPSWAVFLVDGYNLLAASVQNLTVKDTAMTQPVTGLGDSWEKTSPTGISKAELSQAGAFFDDSSNSMHSAFSGLSAVTRIVAWANQGNTIGKAFAAMQGAFSAVYEVLGKVGALTNANASYVVSGQLDRGVIATAWSAQTANWTGASVDYTTDPINRAIPIASATKASPCVVTTSVPHGLTTGQVILTSGNSLAGPSINSEQAVTVLSPTTFSVAVNTTGSTGAGTGGSFVRSSTVNGGAGYQLVSDFSGFSGATGKIRHSADDSSYVDLVTFTAVSAANAGERVTVAGTVNRYLKGTGTVTGSGTLTPFSGFARG